MERVQAVPACPWEHRDRLAQVLERSPDFVGACNLSGRVLFVNVAGLQMVGLPETHPWDKTFIPEYLSASSFDHLRVEALPTALRDGLWRGETTMRHVDGHDIPVSMLVIVHRDQTGTATFLSMVARDITEEKAVLHALEESHSRFEVMTRATSDAIYEFDLQAQEITWYQGLGTAFGYDRAEIGSELEWWIERVHEEDRETVLQGIELTIAHAVPSWRREYRFRRADGKWAHVMDHGVTFLAQDGVPIRMVGAMSDLTERKEMQSRLMLSDRMASLGTLAAGVAHEINNPLAYVLNNLTYVQDVLARTGGALTETQLGRLRQTVTDAQHGAERVRAIVRDLRSFSRASDDARAPVEVQHALEAAISLVKAELAPRAQLVREYREVPRVLANEGRLCQVFVNLLVNAAQAIPEGQAMANEIRVVTRVGKDGEAVIEVRDTGGGISEEAIDRIFDPFFTTKPLGEGTGLGLAVCHGIVSGLGGEIRVSSTSGVGTTFTLHLPSAPALPKEQPTPAPSPVDATARRRLLIIDDERNFLVSLKLLLQPDHDVQTSLSAEEALERIEAGERFDLLLCDLMMPGMTGMELYEHLDRTAPELARRMVFLTGGAFTPRARTFLDEKKNASLEKPLDFDALRKLLARCTPWPMDAASTKVPESAVSSGKAGTLGVA